MADLCDKIGHIGKQTGWPIVPLRSGVFDKGTAPLAMTTTCRGKAAKVWKAIAEDAEAVSEWK